MLHFVCKKTIDFNFFVLAPSPHSSFCAGAACHTDTDNFLKNLKFLQHKLYWMSSSEEPQQPLLSKKYPRWTTSLTADIFIYGQPHD